MLKDSSFQSIAIANFAEQEVTVAAQEQVNKKMALAEQTDIVKNRLLTVEQTAYCMGLKDLINPLSRQNYRTIYTGIGADISTVFLTTNSQTVYGVEIYPPGQEEFDTYLKLWDDIDTDALPVNDARRRVKATDSFEERRARGYWDVGSLVTLSYARCLLVELKKMGVQRESVALINERGKTGITFIWKYPGETEERMRKVIFEAEDIEEIYTDENFRPVDCYYEKAVFVPSDSEELKKIDKVIKEGGVMALGRGFSQIRDGVNVFDMMQGHYREHPVSQSYLEMMSKKFLTDKDRYGWEVFLAEKMIPFPHPLGKDLIRLLDRSVKEYSHMELWGQTRMFLPDGLLRKPDFIKPGAYIVEMKRNIGEGYVLDRLIEKLYVHQGRTIWHILRLSEPERTRVENRFALAYIKYGVDIYEQVRKNADKIKIGPFGRIYPIELLLDREGPNTTMFWTLAPYLLDVLQQRGITEQEALTRILQWANTVKGVDLYPRGLENYEGNSAGPFEICYVLPCRQDSRFQEAHQFTRKEAWRLVATGIV